MTSGGIHHINFVVRDLDAAIERFQGVLGLPTFEVIDHSPRGSRVARSRLGDSWFVLVCPYDDDSVPGQFLAEHGEGFFLLSLDADELEDPRAGIPGWEVQDLGELHGALFQLGRNTSE